jgi:hypothetical protein
MKKIIKFNYLKDGIKIKKKNQKEGKRTGIINNVRRGGQLF